MTPDQITTRRRREVKQTATTFRSRQRRIALALLDRYAHCTHMARFTQGIAPAERATWNEKADRALAELRAVLVTGTLP